MISLVFWRSGKTLVLYAVFPDQKIRVGNGNNNATELPAVDTEKEVFVPIGQSSIHAT